jgi:hypothetical protein
MKNLYLILGELKKKPVRLPRPCLCGRIFQPTGKYQKLCFECYACQSYINPLYALCFNGNRELEGEIAKAIKTLYNNVERVADAKEKEGCDFGGAN